MVKFTEQPIMGGYKMGDAPMVYVYSVATGNMRMTHPWLYAARSIMDRKPSRPKGAVDGKPNDPTFALRQAERHFCNYRPRNK